MPTLNLHASQLPIDGNPDRMVWRIEADGYDVDVIQTPRGGKITFEVSEQPVDEADFERDLTVEMELGEIIKLIESVPHHGDLYDPVGHVFLGLLRSK
jgi:hypothetical protein